MRISRAQLRLLQVARRRLGLGEDDWRTILIRLGGTHSSRLLSCEGFEAVMGYLEHLGFAPLRTAGPFFGARAGMASPEQVQFIRDLWHRYSGGADWQALDGWLERTYRIASLRFVDQAAAGKVIAALRSMADRPRKAG